MGVVGVVSTLEASSEYVLVVTVDKGDRLNCDALMDSFLVREGSSGMGLFGCEVTVVGSVCVAGAGWEDCILERAGIIGRAPRRRNGSILER